MFIDWWTDKQNVVYPYNSILFNNKTLQTVGIWYNRDRPSQVVLVVKNLPANTGELRDMGSIPRTRRSPGGGHGNPLQYSCLENAMDRGAWQDTVHRVTQSQTWLKRLSTHTHGLRTWDSCLWLRKNHSTGPGQRLDVFYPCFKFPRAPQCTSIWYKTKLLP